ncbi:hypothetical protein KUV89_17010 [Marinobacter hydrocarbonoclasticus]|nr:hypothetical protein [Marinobacter nauticus]
MTELSRSEGGPLACLRPYVLVNPGTGNKVKKRIWELTLEECRLRARVYETSDGDDHRILTLKLGKRVLPLEQIEPQCSRLRVPRLKVEWMTEKLLEAVRSGAFDRELLAAREAQKR